MIGGEIHAVTPILIDTEIIRARGCVGGVKSFLQRVAMHRETRQLMGQSATFPIGP